MIKFKAKYKKLYLLGLFVPLVAIGFTAAIYKNSLSSESNIKIKVSQFPAGTNVNYEIMADGNVIEEGYKKISDNAVVDIPVPNDIIKKDSKLISYKLNISSPSTDEISPAKTLDMLLNINKDNGDISLSGSGLDGFSDIAVKKGSNGTENSENITSDWAGLFSMASQNNNSDSQQGDYEQIELAFQNIGIASDFNKLQTGKVEIFFGDRNHDNTGDVLRRYNWALRIMTRELSSIMVLQTSAIGMFFDASIQLNVQRKMQELMAQAHKDYHPSEQMCRIGTFIRSVAHSESKAEVNKHALNKILMNQYLATPNNSAGHGSMVNAASEIDLYTSSFCDHRDNSGATFTLCPPDASVTPTEHDLDLMNKDVDYTRLLGSKLTINVDFADGDVTGTNDHDLEGDESAIIALAKNLYFPNTFEMPEYDRLKRDLRPHYNSRSFAAKMNVAHSSFLNIVGMKSRAPMGQANVTTDTVPPPAPLGTGLAREPEPAPVHTHTITPAPPALQSPLLTTRPTPTTTLTEDSGWAYMKAMLREFGIADENVSGDINDEIDNILGERPSYYAQMEVLTKKIYQHPNFYTNLYDKPANVDRIGASIDAITLMNQRDRFESILRREMLTSILLEEELGEHVEDVNSTIYEQMQQFQN